MELGCGVAFDGVGLGRGGGAWIGADWIGPDRIGPDWIGPDWIGPDRIGPDRIGPDRIGPDRRSDSVGSSPIGSDPIGPGPVGSGPIGSISIRSGLIAAALSFGLIAPSGAAAADRDEEISVTIQVLDERTKAPIPTAAIRHVPEPDRHPVNAETGAWSDSAFTGPEGEVQPFGAGMRPTVDVSAPGYITRTIDYKVRKRASKNVITVLLAPQALTVEASEIEGIGIQFKVDKPLDK